MKIYKPLIFILILATTLQAGPRKHKNPHKRHYYKPHYTHYAPRHHSYYSIYGHYRYYTPVMVTTKTVTTYPTNLVMVTADSVAEDIVLLNRMMDQGMISEKEYERAKKTLLNRIGMSVNPEAQGLTTAEITDQIQTLYQMQTGQLLTEKEYKQQKKKLLALL